ncbi:MAG: hypothetical protein RUMPE_00107 [Eubacteriales bacterium SKADARSKE-1]|nr:hypothetical protein [Eubacteriales bacterium SKADARSKE-1]
MESLQKSDLRKVSSKAGGFFLLVVFFEVSLFFIVDKIICTYYFPIDQTLSAILIAPFSFIVPYMIMLKVMNKKPRDVMSIKKPKGQLFSYVMIGILVANIADFITIYVVDFLKKYNINSKTPESIFKYENTPLGILFFLISLAIVPAISEEFVFRGVILGSLRKFGDNFAIFSSALVFGLMHGNIEQFVFAFILGLYLGYSVTKTNSILPAMIIHFVNNLFSGISYIFKDVENFEFFTQIFYSVVLVVSIFYIVRLFNNNKKQAQKINRSNLSFRSKMSAFFLNPGMILFLIYVAFSLYVSLKYPEIGNA